jgi:hypothetical protein
MTIDTFNEAHDLKFEIQFLTETQKSFEDGNPKIDSVIRILLGHYSDKQNWNKEFYQFLKEKVDSHLKLAQEKFDSL